MTSGRGQDDRGAADRPGPSEADDLVALLYGELTGEDERALRARVAAEPALADQLAEMERVRMLYRGLPEAEPPARVSAQLLAQAAARSAAGSSVGGGPGWWRRLRAWLHPVVAHPGLAGAMTLVLAAGVAGLLLVRKGDELARTRHADRPVASSEKFESTSRAPAATAPSFISPEGDSSGAGGADGRADESARVGAGLQEVESEGELAPPKAMSKAEAKASNERGRADRRDQKPAKERGRSTGAKLDERRKDGDLGPSKAEPTPTTADKPARAAVPSPTAAFKEPAEKAQVDSEADHRSAAQLAPGASSSPPRQAAPLSDGDRSDEARLLRKLHAQAALAAAGKRCLEVRSLGEKIRALDVGYHDKVFLHDPRLMGCLGRSGERVKSK